MKTSNIDNETIKNEMIRDITSLGNLGILIVISLIILGVNKTSITVLIILFILELIGNIIKLIFFKERPKKRLYNNITERITAASFPSLHTTRSTYILCSIYYFTTINSKYLLLALIPLVLISRVLLKKHDYIDVISGFILGIIGFLTLIAINTNILNL